MVRRDAPVKGDEVFALRNAMGITAETPDVWQQCIDQSLCTATARDNQGRLLGIGFVVGNSRHVQLVDLSVHPEARQLGVGASVGRELLNYVSENKIRYVGVTWNKSAGPWLHDWYERAGFVDIDFAMWHRDSLNSTPG